MCSTCNLDLRRADVAPENRARRLYDALVERVQRYPGRGRRRRERAIAPISGNGWNQRVVIDGKVQEGEVNFNAVGPGYFQTLATRSSQAATSTRATTELRSPKSPSSPSRSSRSTSAAGDRSAQSFHIEDSPGEEPRPFYQIVGVVADTKYNDLREDLRADCVPAGDAGTASMDPFLQVVVHSSIGAGGVTPAVTRAIAGGQSGDRGPVQTMERLVSSRS